MEWIKVEDRLPRDERKYFVWTDKNMPMVAQYYTPLEVWNFKGEIISRVTHWAEIEPPTE